MADDTRDKMIDGATRLLAERGLNGMSINDVLDLTGTPRGSVYHHFPGGKRELVAAAVVKLGDDVAGLVGSRRTVSPSEVLDRFVSLWRRLLVGGEFTLGCGVLAVTADAGGDEMLLDAASSAFSRWRAALTDGFVAGGIDPSEAEAAAVVAIASLEGAVALARAERSIEPFDVTVERLRACLGI